MLIDFTGHSVNVKFRFGFWNIFRVSIFEGIIYFYGKWSHIMICKLLATKVHFIVLRRVRHISLRLSKC